MSHATTTAYRELDHRATDGIDVRMLWDADTDRVVIAVDDARSGEAFTVDVRAGESALDVFRHPFAYAGWRGITPVRADDDAVRVAPA